MSGDNAENDEDWIIVSPQDTPKAPDDRPPPDRSEACIDFQCRTRFGTMSFVARPTQKETKAVKSATDKWIKSQEQSLLFRLPVEIRLAIYEHILRIPGPSCGTQIVQHRAHDRKPTSLTVLLTCRAVLAEAETMLYSINRLCLEQPNTFPASLGPRRRPAITKITLPVVSAASLLPALAQLGRSLPNLTSLYIQRKISVKYLDVSSWAVMAPQLITELRKMERPVEVKILTPDGSFLTEHEVARQRKLDGIDERLCGAVQNRDSASRV